MTKLMEIELVMTYIVNDIVSDIELTNLYPTNADIPLAVTNITTNGSANDIEQVYASVNKHRLGIDGKLKGIARIINNSLDSHDYNVVADDNFTNETNDDLLL